MIHLDAEKTTDDEDLWTEGTEVEITTDLLSLKTTSLTRTERSDTSHEGEDVSSD